ncbi:MAG: nicotinamide mononucleotide transporter [Alphaproteobacteria bacterium]|nr:MAG: nicotinamide mononucleotide transporter [Alphaproteobacteria bacterium]
MTPLEAFAALFGLVNITLIARRSLLNYPFGVVTVCLYFIVFAQARLYSAAGLQVFFLAAQLYGWWYWRRAVIDVGTPVPVRTLERRSLLLVLAAGICGTTLLGLVMSRYTDAAAPWFDAGNAAWSMVAQILTDRRHVESWPLWIAINILSVWLFASQGLLVTAGLYAVYLCIACWGWDSWRRAAT